jgi:hypothetical protein
MEPHSFVQEDLPLPYNVTHESDDESDAKHTSEEEAEEIHHLWDI